MCQKQSLRLNLENSFFSAHLHTILGNKEGSRQISSVNHHVIIFILNYPFK